MAKIQMIQIDSGAVDGIHIRKFQKHVEYEIGNDSDQITSYLANLFIKNGTAKRIFVRKEQEPSEKAVIEEVPKAKGEPSASSLMKDAADTNKVDESDSEKDEDLEKHEEDEESETDENLDDNKDKEPEPKSMRVYELAKELDCEWKSIINVANKLDIKIKVPQSGLTKTEADKIKKNFKE